MNQRWADFGTQKTFDFNEDGLLVDDEGRRPQKGFRNNDDFADWINDSVAKRLVSRGLSEFLVPSGGSPIYYTSGAFKAPEKLLVIIQGTGRVRAGVWSIGLVAYSGINAGSALPWVEEAKKRGMEVIILNPNHHLSSLLSERYTTNNGMILHTLAAFEDVIIPSDPKRVWIICHSMGGECALSVVRRFPQWTARVIQAIAMTDAYESYIGNKEMNLWCHKHCLNWVCSKAPKDMPLPKGPASAHRSAGTTDHPRSTPSAFTFVWEFFDKAGADKNEAPENADDLIADNSPEPSGCSVQ